VCFRVVLTLLGSENVFRSVGQVEKIMKQTEGESLARIPIESSEICVYFVEVSAVFVIYGARKMKLNTGSSRVTPFFRPHQRTSQL